MKMSKVERGAIVITGASTGIGEASALHLGRLGYRVFAGVRRESDGAALESKGQGQVQSLLLDVTDEASIAAAASQVTGETGEAGIAGLVNNAGISVNGPLEFIPVSELRRQLEINVIGQIAVTQAFLPLIRRARGRIVNMGSIAGRLGLSLGGPYCASKFALEALSDCMRMELKPWGIEVVLIEPGAIDTPIWKKSMAAAKTLAGSLPDQTMELYGPVIKAVTRVAENAARNAISPGEVARVVEEALTASKPRTRYVVGRDAKVQRWLSVLPDRVRDWVILKYLEKWT